MYELVYKYYLYFCCSFSFVFIIRKISRISWIWNIAWQEERNWWYNEGIKYILSLSNLFLSLYYSLISFLRFIIKIFVLNWMNFFCLNYYSLFQSDHRSMAETSKWVKSLVMVTLISPLPHSSSILALTHYFHLFPITVVMFYPERQVFYVNFKFCWTINLPNFSSL